MFKTSLKNIVFLTTILLSSNVFAVEFQGKFIQGHFILGKTHPWTLKFGLIKEK